MAVNDKGLLIRLPINRAATKLVHDLGGVHIPVVVGDVLLFRYADIR